MRNSSFPVKDGAVDIKVVENCLAGRKCDGPACRSPIQLDEKMVKVEAGQHFYHPFCFEVKSKK